MAQGLTGRKDKGSKIRSMFLPPLRQNAKKKERFFFFKYLIHLFTRERENI